MLLSHNTQYNYHNSTHTVLLPEYQQNINNIILIDKNVIIIETKYIS